MARITPSEGRLNLIELEDDTSYKAVITAIDWSQSGEQYGNENRLQIDFLPEGADELQTIRDWISLRLGKQQNGQVSKLRQLLNAVHGQPSTTEIKWFDDETLEWSYDGRIAADQLTVGREVVFEGVNGQKQDGTPTYRIQRYKKLPSAAAAKPAATKPAARKLQPVGAGANEDEVPF